jgi:hypothetical protein
MHTAEGNVTEAYAGSLAFSDCPRDPAAARASARAAMRFTEEPLNTRITRADIMRMAPYTAPILQSR